MNIDETFRYHTPNDKQLPKYKRLREEGKALAKTIEELCPTSREKSLALTDLQRCVQMANASIAIHESTDTPGYLMREVDEGDAKKLSDAEASYDPQIQARFIFPNGDIRIVDRLSADFETFSNNPEVKRLYSEGEAIDAI